MKRFFLLITLLTLSSCSFIAGTGRPVIEGREISKDEAKKLLSKLKDKDTALQTFRALYKATLSIDGAENTGREALVFEKPQKLRVELFPPTSFYSLGLAVFGGKESWFIDTTEKIARRGEKNDNFLRSSLKIPVGVTELMSLATGTVPSELIDKITENNDAKVFYNESKNEYSIIEGDFYSYWNISGETLLTNRVDFRSRFDDTLSLRVIQGSYTGSVPYSLPSNLEFWAPKEGVKIQLALTTASINDKFSDSLFEAEAPEGFSIYSSQ